MISAEQEQQMRADFVKLAPLLLPGAPEGSVADHDTASMRWWHRDFATAEQQLAWSAMEAALHAWVSDPGAATTAVLDQLTTFTPQQLRDHAQARALTAHLRHSPTEHPELAVLAVELPRYRWVSASSHTEIDVDTGPFGNETVVAVRNLVDGSKMRVRLAPSEVRALVAGLTAIDPVLPRPASGSRDPATTSVWSVLHPGQRPALVNRLLEQGFTLTDSSYSVTLHHHDAHLSATLTHLTMKLTQFHQGTGWYDEISASGAAAAFATRARPAGPESVPAPITPAPSAAAPSPDLGSEMN